MINILRTEFFRLKKSKPFWIFFGICCGLPLLSALLNLAMAGIIESITELPEMSDLAELLRSLNVTTTTLSDLSSLMSDAALFSLICSSVFLSKEFTDGTMRNVLLANKSRKEMFFSYLIVAIVIGVSYLTAFFAATMLFIATLFGFGDLSAGAAVSACFCSFALGIFATIFVQTCVTMFLFAVRKQWATILFPILICMFAPAIFTLIVQIISNILIVNGEIISNTTISWIPFANVTIYDAGKIDGGLIGKIALYYLLFSGIFVVSGYFTFEKADLK